MALPEIGKRTAESIIAELSGKVDQFIEIKSAGLGSSPTNPIASDAVAVLVQLGESRLQARQLVDRALAADPTVPTVRLVAFYGAQQSAQRDLDTVLFDDYALLNFPDEPLDSTYADIVRKRLLTLS